MVKMGYHIATNWYSGSSVGVTAAEELAELRTAVLGVREALSDLRANTEPSRASVLKLNARDGSLLRTQLQQPREQAYSAEPYVLVACGDSALLRMLQLQSSDH